MAPGRKAELEFLVKFWHSLDADRHTFPIKINKAHLATKLSMPYIFVHWCNISDILCSWRDAWTRMAPWI
jgi:hypothetical protein